MSESTVESTTSGPSLESILWAAAERWSDDPGLVDRGEFADYIFDAWGAESPTEEFVARFFNGDPTIARPNDMAEAVSRASRSRMHVYNFDLNRLEYVVIEDADQVVLVSDQGQFSLPNDDFLMRAIERAIIPGSKDPVATGGQFDRKQDGTPRGYFVRRSGEIVAVDVDQLSSTVKQMQLDLKPVFSPIIEDAEGRLMPFKPTRSAMMPNREVELLRQDERISTWTLPKRNTLVSPTGEKLSASDGLAMTAGGAPGLNAPATAAQAVLLLLPDGTLARPVIGSASRWRDMVSDWTTRAAMISIDSSSAPAAVMDDRRYAVQTDRVVAVFSGVRQTTDSSASIGQVGLTSQTRGEAIAAVRMLDANIRVLGDDDLASAIMGGAQFVSGLAAPIMADTRAGTGFWLQPEVIFAPSSDDRAYASREMDLRSAGYDNAALESQLASPSQELVAVQGPTSDPWSNYALQAGDPSGGGASAALIGRDVDGETVGNVMDPSAMALFARSNRNIGSTFDGSTTNFSAGSAGAADVRPGAAMRIPSERVVAFRAPDGAIVYQPQANSQVRLASVHRSVGSSDSGAASYSTQRGAPAPKQFSATIGARSGAMPATALAALATALDRTAAASGYKLPRIVSFESADDAAQAGQYFSSTLPESSPRRSQAMLAETPMLSGSVGRMVLSMPFPTSGEVVVGPDLDEALQAWMVAPAVSVGDGTSAMSSSSYYASAMSGSSGSSAMMLGSFGGAASGAMAGGLALRSNSAGGGSSAGGSSFAGGTSAGGSFGYGSSSMSNASVVSSGNPSIPSSAFASGGGPGAVAAPSDFSGGSFVPGSTYAAGGSLPGAVVSSSAGGVTNFGNAGSNGSAASFASPALSSDAGGISSGAAGGNLVQGANGVSYVLQSVPGAGGSSSAGSVSAPGMGPSLAGVDLGTAHRAALGQATQASFVMQMPAAAETLSSRASTARLPRLLSQAMNSSGQWLPGSGTPLPSAVREFAMSGPFDWPELAQIGAFPQQQELPSGVSTRVLNPGEEEIQIPMPLWAQMGRGQLSSTEAVMASPRMQPGFAPPLGMYRLVKPPEVDFAGGAPEGTPGVITLQGPTELGVDRSLNNSVQASKSGTSFVLGRVPVSDGETLVSRRGRIKIGAPLGSASDAAGSTFSGDSPSSFSALSSMGQIGSFATGGSSAGSAIGGSFGNASPGMTSAGSGFAGGSQASGISSLGGDAPTGTLVTSSAPTTLRVPSFTDTASEAPDLAAASNVPSASGRPFAGALRSALRMSDDVGSRVMPSATSTSSSFSSGGSMIGASGSSSAGWAPSSFGGSTSLVAGQPNFGSGGGIANGVGGSGFGGSSSLVSGAPQGSFVSGGGSAGTSSSALSGFSAGSSGASLVSGATATSGSNGAGAPGVSGLPAGAWSGANPGNLGYTPWVYGSRFEPNEQSRGGVDLNAGSRLGKPSYPSLPGMLRFKYIGAPLWWSSATGNAMASSGTTDSSGAETGAVSRSLSSGLQAANSAASIWRSVFVSPGNQRAGSRGSRGTSDAGSMDSGWDRNADDMASLSSKMALIAVGMGGGAGAATAGSTASKLTGPETVYVAMDSAGRGGMTSASQAGSPGELNMKIVAAIPPTPPPLADMAAATSTSNAVRPRHSKAQAGADEHKDEGGVSRGKIEGSVDAIAQRIYHRIVRRLDSDRERFGG